MPKISSRVRRGAAGEYAISALFLGQVGFIYRPVSGTLDLKVDGYVEAADEDAAGDLDGRGHVFAVQVKTGASYFKNEVADGWVYSSDDEEFSYWLGYSMPVVLVLHDQASGRAWWVEVRRESVTAVGTRSRITVPRSQPLDRTSRSALLRLSAGPPEVQRLRVLLASEGWIRALSEGVETHIAGWVKVNTVTPRGEFTLWQGGTSRGSWFFVWDSLDALRALLHELFPWAQAAESEEEDEREVLLEEMFEESYGMSPIMARESFRRFREERHDMDIYALRGERDVEGFDLRVDLEAADEVGGFIAAIDYVRGKGS